jgi:hypothetical protein
MFSDFYHASYYGLLIAASLVCLFLFKHAEKPFRALSILIMLTSLSELTARYVAFVLFKPNNIVYHFFTPVEFFFYVIIYQQFFNSRKWDYIVWTCFVVLMLGEIFNTIFFQSLNVDNTNIQILESIVLVFFSLSLFIKIRETEYNNKLLKEGVFWFNSAVLFYYTISILIWGFHSIQVYKLKNPPMFIYNFIMVFSELLYATYAFAVGINSNTAKKRMLKDE